MTKFFTVEQVIEIHDAFLEDYGGLRSRARSQKNCGLSETI